MDVSTRERLTDLYPPLAAAAALVVTPLLALSYFAIPNGAGELESGAVSAWADPARDAAGRLLTFAPQDRVYATYIQLLTLLFPAVVLAAMLTWRRRRPVPTRAERVAWRVSLIGYLLIELGLAAVSVALIAASSSSAVVNDLFLALIAPGLVIGTMGSSALGVALLRRRFRPRLTSWLLTLSFPLWIVGSDVIGHNSIGLLPLFIAWAVSQWHQQNERGSAPRSATPTVENATT